MMTLNLLLATGLVAVMAGVAATDETPFACNLKALTLTERTEHREVTARVMASVQETRELPNGYAFTVDSTRVSTRDLATFVEFERRCCPFFDFHLTWTREGGPVTLQLTGRDGVKEFIRAEFALTTASRSRPLRRSTSACPGGPIKARRPNRIAL